MNLTFQKDDLNEFKSKPGLIRLAKELYIEDISDDFLRNCYPIILLLKFI